MQCDRRLGPLGKLPVLQEGRLGGLDAGEDDGAFSLDEEELDRFGYEPRRLATLDVLDVVEFVEDQEFDASRLQEAVDTGEQDVLAAVRAEPVVNPWRAIASRMFCASPLVVMAGLRSTNSTGIWPSLQRLLACSSAPHRA